MPRIASAAFLPSVLPAFFTAASMKRVAIEFSHDQLVGYSLLLALRYAS